MRCPKCGYISFDRQRSCGKCSNDLTSADEQLRGTASKAATPFFLDAILGKQKSAEAGSSPVFHEEEESFDLDELGGEAPPAGEDELDFSGAPLDEGELEDQPLPSLGLEDIDVSDLMPPQEVHLGNEQKETILAPVPAKDEEEDSLMGIELPGLDPDELLSADEQERPSAGAEDDEIIDLSSLMGFDDATTQSADREEERDILGLSLEEGENAPDSAETSKKTASTVADIPDLGLTLENDDK